jgi:hypothetical protein
MARRSPKAERATAASRDRRRHLILVAIVVGALFYFASTAQGQSAPCIPYPTCKGCAVSESAVYCGPTQQPPLVPPSPIPAGESGSSGNRPPPEGRNDGRESVWYMNQRLTQDDPFKFCAGPGQVLFGGGLHQYPVRMTPASKGLGTESNYYIELSDADFARLRPGSPVVTRAVTLTTADALRHAQYFRRNSPEVNTIPSWVGPSAQQLLGVELGGRVGALGQLNTVLRVLDSALRVERATARELALVMAPRGVFTDISILGRVGNQYALNQSIVYRVMIGSEERTYCVCSSTAAVKPPRS